MRFKNNGKQLDTSQVFFPKKKPADPYARDSDQQVGSSIRGKLNPQLRDAIHALVNSKRIYEDDPRFIPGKKNRSPWR